MQLKPLRKRLGMSQQQLAEHLDVSQQTVARWEQATHLVPTRHLRDLAVVLGCTVTDIIEDRLVKREMKVAVNDDDALPYGTLRLSFDGERADASAREYPITQGTKELIGEQSDYSVECPWFSFSTLDDRFVFVNSQHVKEIRLVCDDVETMPCFEHEETLGAMRFLLNEGSLVDRRLEPDVPFSAKRLGEARRVIEEWGGQDAAIRKLEGLSFEDVDGTQHSLLLEATVMAALRTRITEASPHHLQGNSFINLGGAEEEGAVLFRISALRTIEIPLTKWREFSEGNDSDE